MNIKITLITKMKTIISKNNYDLINIIQKEIALNGNDCDLNHIDTSCITNISEAFKHSEFNGDISNWNISSVTNMKSIFEDTNSEKPWWAIEDNNRRKIAIENYHLMQKLDINLTKQELLFQTKKKKI